MTGNTPPAQNDPNHYSIGHPPQAQAHPKKKSKTLWIVLGAAGVAVLLCCGFGVIAANMGDTGGDQTGKQNVAEQNPESPSLSPIPSVGSAGVGTPVRDGKFEFTVTAVKCGVAKVGDSFLDKKAQGQFCVVSLQVKNIGDQPRTFNASNQQGFGAGDVKYGADGVASMYANDDSESFLNDINPGNGITVDVVFDIPKDGRLLSVMLHDSALSGGAKVVLG